MSELRWHPFLSEWVITATHRQERTFLPPVGFCPLCPTRPGGFPTEIPDADFDVAVFDNKFPSLQPGPPAPAVEAAPLSPVRPAGGRCEVVVYSPDHEAALASLPVERVRHLLRVWRDRYLALGAEPGIEYVMIFENKGEAVGVTLHHPHGQIYAFPFVPPVPERELRASRAHRQATGRCLLCDTLATERADGRRLVLAGERHEAFVPFHARWPFETWIAPRAHQASMADWTREDVDDLAAVLQATLVKLDGLFGRPFPYMLVIHQAPTGAAAGGAADSHLHLELYSPQRAADRLKFLASCESGAGTFINDTLPEESAARLRRLRPRSTRAHLEPGRPARRLGARQPPLAEALAAAFGEGPAAASAFAPGRVNLIGEHTDYNEGFVLPMALPVGVGMVARPRAVREVRALAADLGETVAFPLDGPHLPDPERPWSNYLRGVVQALQQAGVRLEGVDLAFGGTLAQGAGLSSSAALGVATALSLQALHGFPMDVEGLARACQAGEHALAGVQCGIMDPFVSLAARAGHALLLDCRSLHREQVPLRLDGHAVAVIHSGVRHSLAGSEYNLRRRDCALGVAALRARFPEVAALRDASLEQLEACRDGLDPVVFRRCRHVIAEDARVQAAIAALRAGDLGAFGALMDGSHASLRDDYQVSCPEVDLLVALTRRTPGVLGSRITGGGFGGCTVSLVEREALDRLRAEVLPEYRRRTGHEPRLFVGEAADGAEVE